MTNEEQASKIPTRKLPEFRVRKSQIKDMKAAAKMLDMLSENPDILKQIVDEMLKASTAADEDAALASYEAKQNILDILSENLKDLPEEDIERNMVKIWGNIPPWYINHEFIHGDYWGPYEGEVELGRQMKDRYRRRYKW